MATDRVSAIVSVLDTGTVDSMYIVHSYTMPVNITLQLLNAETHEFRSETLRKQEKKNIDGSETVLC